MNSFLFITHLTPSFKRSPLRQYLYEIYRKSLSAQTYSNWKVLIIGENEKKEGNFFEVALDSYCEKEIRNERIKKLYERSDIINYIENIDYIIKLDDDDIISPTLLEKIKNLKFDVYYDEYHTFYDTSSGFISQQKRPWIASTCIHKTDHALSKADSNGSSNYYLNSLLYQDHSKAWHIYYKDKHKIIANQNSPVYLRVLSPTSITSGVKKFPLSSIDDIDFKLYYKYLKSFGYWEKAATQDFDIFLNDLGNAWINFTNKRQESIPYLNMTNKITDCLINYGKTFRKIF